MGDAVAAAALQFRRHSHRRQPPSAVGRPDRPARAGERTSARRACCSTTAARPSAPRALDAEPDVILQMPGDSLAPLLLSIALAVLFIGMLVQSWWLFGAALAASLLATIVWLWPEARLGQTMDIAHE